MDAIGGTKTDTIISKKTQKHGQSGGSGAESKGEIKRETGGTCKVADMVGQNGRRQNRRSAAVKRGTAIKILMRGEDWFRVSCKARGASGGIVDIAAGAQRGVARRRGPGWGGTAIEKLGKMCLILVRRQETYCAVLGS